MATASAAAAGKLREKERDKERGRAARKTLDVTGGVHLLKTRFARKGKELVSAEMLKET